MITVSASADRNGERRWHTGVPCFLTGLGLILSAVPTDSIVLAMMVLTVATAGAFTAPAAFWSLPSAFRAGAAAAARIALIKPLRNIAAYVSNTSALRWGAG